MRCSEAQWRKGNKKTNEGWRKEDRNELGKEAVLGKRSHWNIIIITASVYPVFCLCPLYLIFRHHLDFMVVYYYYQRQGENTSTTRTIFVWERKERSGRQGKECGVVRWLAVLWWCRCRRSCLLCFEDVIRGVKENLFCLLNFTSFKELLWLRFSVSFL